MRSIAPLILVLVCFFQSFLSLSAHASMEGGRGAVFYNAAGKQVALDDFRGRPLILNFWATWCGPCVAEMPALDNIQGRHGWNRLKVLAIAEETSEDAPQKIADFYQRNGIYNLDIYVDPTGALAREFGVGGVPTTVLLSPDGSEYARVDGMVDWEAPKYRNLVRDLVHRRQR